MHTVSLLPPTPIQAIAMYYLLLQSVDKYVMGGVYLKVLQALRRQLHLELSSQGVILLRM